MPGKGHGASLERKSDGVTGAECSELTPIAELIDQVGLRIKEIKNRFVSSGTSRSCTLFMGL